MNNIYSFILIIISIYCIIYGVLLRINIKLQNKYLKKYAVDNTNTFIRKSSTCFIFIGISFIILLFCAATNILNNSSDIFTFMEFILLCIYIIHNYKYKK